MMGKKCCEYRNLKAFLEERQKIGSLFNEDKQEYLDILEKTAAKKNLELEGKSEILTQETTTKRILEHSVYYC